MINISGIKIPKKLLIFLTIMNLSFLIVLFYPSGITRFKNITYEKATSSMHCQHICEKNDLEFYSYNPDYYDFDSLRSNKSLCTCYQEENKSFSTIINNTANYILLGCFLTIFLGWSFYHLLCVKFSGSDFPKTRKAILSGYVFTLIVVLLYYLVTPNNEFTHQMYQIELKWYTELLNDVLMAFFSFFWFPLASIVMITFSITYNTDFSVIIPTALLIGLSIFSGLFYLNFYFFKKIHKKDFSYLLTFITSYLMFSVVATMLAYINFVILGNDLPFR